MRGTGELVVIAISAVQLPTSPSQKVLTFPTLPIQCWLHWCIKTVSDWLCSVTTSMAVVKENEYILTRGRRQSTKVPVTLLPWGMRVKSDG